MSGINTGILTNASPLSSERINALEAEILNGSSDKCFAYLDENSKLCFTMSHAADVIKELAWDNAYQLTNDSGTLTKKAYKKTGLKTFALDKTFTKTVLTATWGSGITELFKFDSDLEDRPHVLIAPEIFIVKVSDKYLSANDLIGAEMTIRNCPENISTNVTIFDATTIPDNFTGWAVVCDAGITLVAEFTSGDYEGMMACFSFDTKIEGEDYTLEPGTYFACVSLDNFLTTEWYVESLSTLNNTDASEVDKLPSDQIFNLLDHIDDVSDAFRIILESSQEDQMGLLKVSNKYFTYDELLYRKMSMYISLTDKIVEGVIRPEHMDGAPDPETGLMLVLANSNPCGDKISDDFYNFPAIVSVPRDLDFEGIYFEKGTYFAYSISKYDGRINVISLSCLSKKDALWQ